MNLTSEETMNSLGPILEENIKNKIFIPGLSNREKINNLFLFISCQNLSNILGRKQLTNLLKSRIKIIAYPEQSFITNGITDFENICINVNDSLSSKRYNNIECVSFEEAKNIGKFILRFNDKNEGFIYNLNFRDVKKILKRVYFQNDNKFSYFGFNIYNNILFYILAQTKEKDKEKMSKYIIPLLAEIFNENNYYNDDYYYNESFYPNYSKQIISNKIKTELEECFYSETKFIEENGVIFLSKGKCKINVDSILTKNDKNNILEYNKLDTFLESFFLSKLALNDEPLLILGDTGYKTYLAEKLLNNKSYIINLNPETKLNYLLGASIFFSKNEAAEFYLKNYLNLVIDDFSKERKFNYYKKNINKDGKILDEKTKEILKNYLKDNDCSIKNKICIKLLDKLTKNSDKKENLILENIVLEYNPGLITYAYLGKENIILKNLSYLDTSIIERFNELFSESQIITLNEDIHKTFTDEKDKILKLEHIRTIATSYSEYESKLSEAIASRFTLVEVNPYNEKEENVMIRLYSKENNLKIKEEIFQILEDFSFDYKNTFDQRLSLNQKLNIINILSLINNDIDEPVKNAKLTLYMLTKNSFKNRNSEKLKKLKEILNYKFIEYKNGEAPLTIEKKNHNLQLVSKITKLNIDINHHEEILNDNIYFHKNFSELVDIIHFSLKSKVGLIIEGMKGQGKKTAINYIANLLGYNILNIYLNESTKIEDILGSLVFENENNELKMLNVKTDFLKAIESKVYTIIIFHNINKANSSIIDLIANFYRKKRSIYNINLNKIEPQYNYNFFICIFNYENSIKGQDYLPSSLTHNSIYFQMENNAINYLNEIIIKKFQNNNNFYEEHKKFFNSFSSVYKFDKEDLKESNDATLSLNEIDKFIKLRKETFNKLDINIILGFVFIFRYSSNTIQEKIKNILKFGNLNTSLKFYFDSESITIEILINKKYYYLSISLNPKNNNVDNKINIDIDEINKNIVSLTAPQRYCLLFLVCSFLSNKPCILQGETSSGKTHLIRLFANIMGKKLNIYQMNNDSNIIMINGQSKSEDLNNEEFNRLKILKEKLEKLIIFNNKNNEINAETIKNLLEDTNEYVNKIRNDEEKTKKINDIKNQILKIISPINRFKYHKSSFCESLEKGEWILIEQIESAPSEVLERIIPLTMENPEIKIIQGAKEIIYKMNIKDK